jgi:predicted naringenin-chalcone synthase
MNIIGTYPFILGIGTGDPNYCYSQKDMADFAVQYFNLTAGSELEQKLRKIYEHTNTITRYSVVDYHKCNPSEDFKSFQSRNDIYAKNAVELSRRSATEALKKWGGDKSKITHLVYCSTTGVTIPGVEFELAEILELSPHVQRCAINFMGCYSALPGIKTACAFAKLNPKNRVLLVSTEICSVHIEEEVTLENFVSSALFADGSGAMVIGCNPSNNEKAHWAIHRTSSSCLKKSKDKMYWNITDKGWRLGLSKEIPFLIEENIGEFKSVLFGKDLDVNKVDWAIHPGGKSILIALETSLGIKREQNRAAWNVLKDHGNMSSSTIIFVLKNLIDQAKFDTTICMAFGPGLVIEGAVLLKV